jgi:DNA-binding response OmpR family regulator
LKIQAPGLQTLIDMAEKPSTEASHRLLLAAERVAEGFSVAGWLEREGFDVMTAADGQEALQIACSSWQPDVVLLDLTLPDINGLAVCEQIRAKNKRVVIFVIGGEPGEVEIPSLDAGADDFLAKGFAPELLLARVRAHVRSRQAAGDRRILMHGDLWLGTVCKS